MWIEWYWVLLLCIFCHIVEDFFLQGIMANMKQKGWWKKNVPEEYQDKVKYDYIPVLLLHGIEWAVCVAIPLIVVFGFTLPLFVLTVAMALIHAIVDDMKCNRFKINLVADQTIHIVQIAIMVVIMYAIGG